MSTRRKPPWPARTGVARPASTLAAADRSHARPARRRAPAGKGADVHAAVRVPAAEAGLPGFQHRNLPLLLLQAREAVMARFRPILNAHGVTEQQWRILRALLEAGPLEPRQIGQVCRISSPSLAGVLARMDELGLVQRERWPQDQRRVMVALTARSQALAVAMAPDIEAAYAVIEAHIGPAFIDHFYGALDQLMALLDSLPAVESAQSSGPLS